MKKKRGLDQTTAWICSIILSSLTFSGAYFGIGFFAKSGHDDDSSSLHAKIKTHGDDDHSEASHGATKLSAKRHLEAKAEKAVLQKEKKTLEKITEARKEASTPSQSPYTYNGITGPDNWADLAKANIACSVGTSQSPIDISQATNTRRLEPIATHYGPQSGEFKNGGHSLRVEFNGDSYAEFNELKYKLIEMNFHAPSEHKVDGIPYDMEVQLVHRSKSGKLAIVGILVEETPQENRALAKLWRDMPKKGGLPVEVTFNPKDLLPKENAYYRYQGSLTTPPCTEGVDWYVMAEPIKFSAKQIDAFIHTIRFNARPVQPLHTRNLEKINLSH